MDKEKIGDVFLALLERALFVAAGSVIGLIIGFSGGVVTGFNTCLELLHLAEVL